MTIYALQDIAVAYGYNREIVKHGENSDKFIVNFRFLETKELSFTEAIEVIVYRESHERMCEDYTLEQEDIVNDLKKEIVSCNELISKERVKIRKMLVALQDIANQLALDTVLHRPHWQRNVIHRNLVRNIHAVLITSDDDMEDIPF